MKSLVVGASGQVGAALMEALKARGHEALGTYSSHPIAEGLAFDLLKDDPVKLLRDTMPRFVFCPAGATHVDGCEQDPVTARVLNMEGPLRLAESAQSFKAKFVYYSTEYVFDGDAGPYDEDAAPNPISVYGWTKSLGERLVINRVRGSLAIRTTVIYGPDPQKKNTVYQLSKILGQGGSFRSPGDQITTPTYGPDLALSSVILAERGISGVVHAAGSEVMSRYDLSLAACRVLGLDEKRLSSCLTAELDQKAKRPLKAGLLSPRLETLTGVRMRTVAEGLAELKTVLKT